MCSNPSSQEQVCKVDLQICVVSKSLSHHRLPSSYFSLFENKSKHRRPMRVMETAGITFHLARADSICFQMRLQ